MQRITSSSLCVDVITCGKYLSYGYPTVLQASGSEINSLEDELEVANDVFQIVFWKAPKDVWLALRQR
jgi:hypothetical protein